MGFGFWKEGEIMKRMDILGSYTGINKNFLASGIDDFFLVNIAYDKILVEAFDEYDIPVGRRPIVDREALYQFLDSINGIDYKCIVLDVRLYQKDATEFDSLLVASINRMPRLLLVNNPEQELPEGIDKNKVADASYGIHYLNSDFLKFKYQYDDQPGLALATFNVIDKKQHDLHGFLPMDEGHLAQSNIYLPLHYRVNSAYNEQGDLLIYNLRVNILDVYNRKKLSELLTDKIIVIGDYTETDLHNTYAGNMHGPVILINAIEALREGRHLIWVSHLIIMFIIYTLLVMSMVSAAQNYMPEFLANSVFLRGLALLIGYGAVLLLMAMGFYLTSGIMYDFLYPFIFLSLLNLITDPKTKEFIKLIFKTK